MPWFSRATIWATSSDRTARAGQLEHRFDEMVSSYAELVDVRPEGYAVDKRFPDIMYVPEDARFDLHKQTVSWRA